MSRILDELKFSQKDPMMPPPAPAATDRAVPDFGSSPENMADQTILAADTVFKGTIKFKGFLKIDGRVEGDVESKGTVVVGKTGYIKGKIVSVNVKVEGKIEGNIIAERKVHFLSSAQMRGDVVSAQLAIEEGVTIVGNCDVSPTREKPAEAQASAPAPAPAPESKKAEDKKDLFSMPKPAVKDAPPVSKEIK